MLSDSIAALRGVKSSLRHLAGGYGALNPSSWFLQAVHPQRELRQHDRPVTGGGAVPLEGHAARAAAAHGGARYPGGRAGCQPCCAHHAEIPELVRLVPGHGPRPGLLGARQFGAHGNKLIENTHNNYVYTTQTRGNRVRRYNKCLAMKTTHPVLLRAISWPQN